MRHPAHRILLIALVVSLGVFAGRRASADDRSDARTHYQSGLRLFNAGDFRGAVGEFTKAQQLAPADLNEYNLGLCYDKLGEAENAITHYRTYLDHVPDAPKRGEIEASITRLDAAVKSAAAKRADEQKREEDARRAEDAKRAEDARRAEDAKRATQPPAAPQPPTGGDVGVGVGGSVGTTGGSIGTPGTGVVAPPTGDQQLDRVNSIDINAVRQQRVGNGASGMVDPRMGGQPGQPGQPGTGQVATGAPNQPPYQQMPNGAPPAPGDQPPPKKDTPIYKKWWFWAFVVGAGVVLYAVIATSSQPSPGSSGTVLALPPHHNAPAAAPGGLTLWRF